MCESPQSKATVAAANGTHPAIANSQKMRRTISVGFRARGANDAGVLVRLGLDVGGEFRWRVAHRLGAQVEHLLAHVGLGERAHEFIVEARCDILRDTTRREDAEPGADVETRQAGFRDGGELW